MIATEIISDYEKLCASITNIVDASGYKLDFICKKLELTRMAFYRKRKSGKFKPDELRKLFEIIDHGNLEDKMLGKIMQMSENTAILNESETKEFFNKAK
ncbi:MAG: hypothetical protein ACK504_10370 [Bacteroidota bacterium]